MLLKHHLNFYPSYVTQLIEISTADLTANNPFPVDVLIQLSSPNLVAGFPFIGYSSGVSLVRNLVTFRLGGVGGMLGSV